VSRLNSILSFEFQWVNETVTVPFLRNFI